MIAICNQNACTLWKLRRRVGIGKPMRTSWRLAIGTRFHGAIISRCCIDSRCFSWCKKLSLLCWSFVMDVLKRLEWWWCVNIEVADKEIVTDIQKWGWCRWIKMMVRNEQNEIHKHSYIRVALLVDHLTQYIGHDCQLLSKRQQPCFFHNHHQIIEILTKFRPNVQIIGNIDAPSPDATLANS